MIFIYTLVDALGVSVLLQRPVAKLRPRRLPFLGLGLLVPVGGGNGLAFVLPLFRVTDFLSLRVKNVLLFLLRSPCAALVGVVVGDAVPFVGQYFAAAVSGCANSRLALAPVDNLDTAMVNCYAPRSCAGWAVGTAVSIKNAPADLAGARLMF